MFQTNPSIETAVCAYDRTTRTTITRPLLRQ